MINTPRKGVMILLSKQILSKLKEKMSNVPSNLVTRPCHSRQHVKKSFIKPGKLHKGTVSAGKRSYNGICSRRLMAYIIFKMQKNINRRDQLKRKYSSLLFWSLDTLALAESHIHQKRKSLHIKPSTKTHNTIRRRLKVDLTK